MTDAASDVQNTSVGLGLVFGAAFGQWKKGQGFAEVPSDESTD